MLEIQQTAMAVGTFTLNRIAKTAAKSICIGKTKIIEKKDPIANPAATVSRHGIQSARLNKGFVIARHHGRSRSLLCFSIR